MIKSRIFPSFITAIILHLSVVAFSQAPPTTTGNWVMFFNQTRVSERWSIHAEAQFRSYELAPNAEQLLLRAGMNYHINSAFLATAGYASVFNYDADKARAPGTQTFEHRLWQQFIIRNNLGRVGFEHRYRLEQRWLQTGDKDQYLNRARYLLRATVPLNHISMEKNTWFLTFYDELFIHLTDTPFDRNRLYGALGYQFVPHANAQVGYLAQTVAATTRHFLQLALFYNLDLRKQDQ